MKIKEKCDVWIKKGNIFAYVNGGPHPPHVEQKCFGAYVCKVTFRLLKAKSSEDDKDGNNNEDNEDNNKESSSWEQSDDSNNCGDDFKVI